MDSKPTATSKLVISSDAHDVSSDITEDEADISFRLNNLLELKANVPVDAGLMAEHFAHAVAASPSDLLRHTQRIFFLYQQFDSDGLYSALYDLFVALQDKGIRLRKRLLQGSRDRLQQEQYAVLSLWLAQGEPRKKEGFPLPNQSVLSRGITGVRDIIKVSYDKAGPQRDPLLEAREFIDYFQIDEARNLLEKAIFEQPERVELHLELIQLYQATRDNNGLQSMREKLIQYLPELPECWLTVGGKTHVGEKKT